MSKKAKVIFELFITFLKIGAFTFGGGYAMIALLQNEFVTKKEWLSDDDFLDIIAIAESTPGPIAINSSTFIGYKKAGFWGSFFSTLAMCIPSFTIIYIISLFFDKFLSFKYVEYAFKGVGACVVYLIFSAGLKMLKGLKKDIFSKVVFVTVLLVFIGFSLFAVKFSTLYYILLCGALGLFFYGVKKAKEDKNDIS